jgi:hypothetical protein
MGNPSVTWYGYLQGGCEQGTNKHIVWRKEVNTMATKRRKNQVETPEGEVVVQLATRVPKALYRELKLFSVTESRSISELVTTYVRDGLAAAQKTKPRRKPRSEREDDAA